MKKRSTVNNEEKSRKNSCSLLIKYAEKEIYENVTQCICLAKMQIGMVELQNIEEARARIHEAGILLGQAVKDLRKLVETLAIRNTHFS